jgi:hypothetical protein
VLGNKGNSFVALLLASSYLLSCEFRYKEVGITSRQLHHFAELLRRVMTLCALTC